MVCTKTAKKCFLPPWDLKNMVFAWEGYTNQLFPFRKSAPKSRFGIHFGDMLVSKTKPRPSKRMSGRTPQNEVAKKVEIAPTNLSRGVGILPPEHVRERIWVPIGTPNVLFGPNVLIYLRFFTFLHFWHTTSLRVLLRRCFLFLSGCLFFCDV